MKKYQIIYADPPWQQSRGGAKAVRKNSSGIELPYKVIPLEEIKSILFDATAHGTKNHAFFMWTIDKYLWEAEQIGKELGYNLHARMVWNKVTGIPAAFTIRFGHEYLLWFYKEGLMPIAREQRGKWHSVLTEQVKKHSQKPEIAYQFIESIYPDNSSLCCGSRKIVICKDREAPHFDCEKCGRCCGSANTLRLELFARNKRAGWDSWGNEVKSDIELQDKCCKKCPSKSLVTGEIIEPSICINKNCDCHKTAPPPEITLTSNKS